MDLKPVLSDSDITKVHDLAWEIFPPFYRAFLPPEHIRFFLRKFQSPEAIRRQLDAGWEYYLLYHDEQGNDQPLGYLGLEWPPHQPTETLVISKLYIRSEFRRSGLGKKAVARIMDIAQEAGASNIQLNVICQNESTVAFYLQLGFEVIDRFTICFEDDYPVENYRMIRHLP